MKFSSSPERPLQVQRRQVAHKIVAQHIVRCGHEGDDEAETTSEQSEELGAAPSTPLQIHERFLKGTLATVGSVGSGLREQVKNVHGKVVDMLTDTEAVGAKQLLETLIMVPSLSLLDIRGTQYPLEEFLRHKILESIDAPKKWKENEDVEHYSSVETLVIDFAVTSNDQNSFVVNPG